MNVAWVGMIGGSFDPVHEGHIQLAREILGRYPLAKLYMVPARANPLKPTPVASSEQRLDMLRLAIEEIPDLRLEISDFEIRKTTPSYTIDTVEYLKEQSGAEIVLIIGDEIFPSLPEWHRPLDLVRTANIAVTTRLRSQSLDMADTLRQLGINPTHISADGTRVEHSGGRFVERVPITAPPFSSTEIRSKIASDGLLGGANAPRGVQRSVWQYIKENHVYAVS